jgi:hypothetical protein
MMVFDIEALGDLEIPLPSLTASQAERRDFWSAWAEASAQKDADFLEGDRTAHRRAWEA